jgi:hypothetical protein
VDRGEIMILLRVATQIGENPIRLKSKGLSAMFVSWQLAGPKHVANLNMR